ncbi:MAG: GNAT family N-acetyltransferase [Candidatus Geothermincolia bacterium]
MGELIRPAAVEDCRALAYHAYLAGKSHLNKSVYDYMFPGVPGPTDSRLTLIENLLQTRVVSWFHYSFCSVAEMDGQVAASLCHYHNRDGAYNQIGPALVELGWDKEDLMAMLKRMQPFFDVDFEHGVDSVIVENVATSAMYRRRGLVSALIENAAGLARKESFKDMQLGVFTGNEPARKAYEKMGFKVVAEKTSPAFEELMGSKGMQQMKMEL